MSRRLWFWSTIKRKGDFSTYTAHGMMEARCACLLMIAHSKRTPALFLTSYHEQTGASGFAVPYAPEDAAPQIRRRKKRQIYHKPGLTQGCCP